jgi:predicted DNA-binding transcriptional regulator YafY
MNRTDRLLAIILELQRHRWRRARDLAATFETSNRTIYRDIQALGEAGVPIVALPGRGYALMEGYFLPPLSFSIDEATMLLLGSDFMAQNFDAQYRAAAQLASRKIEDVLPEKLRKEVHALRERIRFITTGPGVRPDIAARLQGLRQAIIACCTVRFRYYTRHTADEAGTPTTREADPYSLTYIGGAWYLLAYCHLRRGVRTFRLDRMDDLTLLDRSFTRPASLALHQRDLHEAGTLVVRVLFDPEVTRWVRESPSFYTVAEEETTDGLLVTLHVRQESEIQQWLLSWGRHVRVLEPASLRDLIAAEAAAILAYYQ